MEPDDRSQGASVNPDPVVPLCHWIDITPPTDRKPEPVPAWSLVQLESVLREYATRTPGSLEVHLPENGYMYVGIGGDLGTVIAFPIPDPPRGLMPGWAAQAALGPSTHQSWEFVSYGIPTNFEPAVLIPTEEVIEIVLDFVRCGDLPGSHQWKSPQGDEYRWGPGGTRDVWAERIRRFN